MYFWCIKIRLLDDNPLNLGLVLELENWTTFIVFVYEFYKLMIVWLLTMSFNNPHLFGRKDEAAGSWQNDTRQLERKDCILTYIKFIYSGFILDKYLRTF